MSRTPGPRRRRDRDDGKGAGLSQPGTAAPAVPLRPLGVSELLDGAVRAVRANARASFAITLPVALVRTAVVASLMLSTASDEDFATVQLLVQLFVSGLLGTVLTGLLAPLYTDEVLATRLPARACLRRVGRSALPLVALALAVALAQEVGVVLLFVGGAWLWGVWALAAPALVTERLGPVAALRRSVDLVRDGFWRVWGVRSLRWLVTSVLGTLLTLPFTALAAAVSDTDLLAATPSIGNAGLYVTIVALGNLLSLTLLSPVSAAVDTMLYLDARIRREGLDIAVGLRALDAAAAAAGAGRTGAAGGAAGAGAPSGPAW